MKDEVKRRYLEEARKTAELVIEKQQAYGDSFGRAGAVLKILYPEGIRPEQYDDALALIRVIDKLFRVATQKDAFGESPWKDINGYALLSVVRDSVSKAMSDAGGGAGFSYRRMNGEEH